MKKISIEGKNIQQIISLIEKIIKEDAAKYKDIFSTDKGNFIKFDFLYDKKEGKGQNLVDICKSLSYAPLFYNGIKYRVNLSNKKEAFLFKDASNKKAIFKIKNSACSEKLNYQCIATSDVKLDVNLETSKNSDGNQIIEGDMYNYVFPFDGKFSASGTGKIGGCVDLVDFNNCQMVNECENLKEIYFVGTSPVNIFSKEIDEDNLKELITRVKASKTQFALYKLSCEFDKVISKNNLFGNDDVWIVEEIFNSKIFPHLDDIQFLPTKQLDELTAKKIKNFFEKEYPSDTAAIARLDAVIQKKGSSGKTLSWIKKIQLCINDNSRAIFLKMLSNEIFIPHPELLTDNEIDALVNDLLVEKELSKTICKVPRFFLKDDESKEKKEMYFLLYNKKAKNLSLPAKYDFRRESFILDLPSMCVHSKKITINMTKAIINLVKDNLGIELECSL